MVFIVYSDAIASYMIYKNMFAIKFAKVNYLGIIYFLEGSKESLIVNGPALTIAP